MFSGVVALSNKTCFCGFGGPVWLGIKILNGYKPQTNTRHVTAEYFENDLCKKK